MDVTGGVREATASGMNASVLLRARTGSSFALFAKLGYAKYDCKLTETIAAGISYGLGVTYTFSRKYLVRAEFEGISIQDGSYNTVMLSAGYRF